MTDNQPTFRHALPQLLVATLMLFVGTTFAQQSVSGTVQAPAGFDAAQSYIISCRVLANNECDTNTWVWDVIGGRGQTLGFTLRDVPAGPRRMMAWKDIDQNDDINDGDLLGFALGTSGEQLVSAPSQNVTIRMDVYGAAPTPTSPATNNTTNNTTNSGSTPPVAAAPSGQPSAYLVSGLVTDGQGRPVANADVNIRNAVYMADVRTRTGPDGRYQVNVPEGSWIAEAFRTVRYHNVEYCLSARPANTEAIWARDGGVRDFVFLIQGENPRGGEPYGGEIELEPYLGDGVPHGSTQTIFITLTPDGPLIDGSVGQTLSGPVEFTHENFSLNTFYLYDIPFGRYRVSAAWQQPNGTSRPLSVRNIDSDSALYGTDIIQFDSGFLGCGAKYYSMLELSI